jgi:hypothetical protein
MRSLDAFLSPRRAADKGKRKAGNCSRSELLWRQSKPPDLVVKI